MLVDGAGQIKLTKVCVQYNDPYARSDWLSKDGKVLLSEMQIQVGRRADYLA